jgi:phosphoenolpyruvate synthase/pyruvate phosphate dikinase
VSRPDQPLVAWLGAVEGTTSLVGGKAASLDRLARLGFRIPPGFCLTTGAFEAQLATIPDVAAAVADLPSEDARTRLTHAFASAPLAPAIRGELDAAVERLVAELAATGAAARPRFAVRSSGIAEDGSAASFAGLHETELGVAPVDIGGAVRRCWASLWSAPALAYRVRKGLSLDGGGMAVVVQALVPADAAAVVFTRHPVTGRSDQLVITGVRGLGEAMVSGTVTPDTWVVDRASGATIEFTPGDRATGQVGAALDAALLDELTRLAVSVEAGFGGPVDIEAAAAAGAWYLLQARPITA